MSEFKTLTDLEVIKIAWDIEKAGQAFYKAAAKVTTEIRAIELFKLLARQEIKHEQRFAKMFQELDRKITGSIEASQYLFDDQISQYLRALTDGVFFPDAAAAKAWIESHPNASDILNFAIKVEKDAILFYLEILSRNVFSYTHDMLDEIIKEEKRHVAMLYSLHNRIGARVA